MNEVMRNRQLVRLAVCLVGMAAMVIAKLYGSKRNGL